MTFRSILYGFRDADLDEQRRVLEEALTVQFEARESLYRGGAYYRYRIAGEADLVLQCNYDALDDEPAEEDHPEMKIILYVDGDPDCVGGFESEISERVSSAEMLRRMGD